MSKKLNRREFVRTTTAAGIAAAAASKPLFGQAPTVMTPKSVKPCVVASSNGNRSKDDQGVTCVAKAFKMMTEGADVLDALVAGVSIVELDPNQTGVGWSGLPNADGVVQLDSCCMHGPKKRAGGVAAVEGVRTPSLVAKAVLEQTDHHLIVGKGAQDFARAMGFNIEDDLNTENSRRKWLDWKRRIDPKHYLDPARRSEAGDRARREMVAEGLLDPEHVYGTINCDGINGKGEICGVTTTSGLSWKIPGRVGDSPILGAGLYLDGEVGAAGSTGRGEANLFNLSSYLIVEGLRRGLHPKDAGMEALKRVAANTVEKRLLNDRGHPMFDLKFYVLDRQGRHAGLAMHGGKEKTYAVCTEAGPQTLACDVLFEEADTE